MLFLFGENDSDDDDDATTAIDRVMNEEQGDHQKGVWYNIRGERLNNKPTQKGIYIYDGKKIIIK